MATVIVAIGAVAVAPARGVSKPTHTALAAVETQAADAEGDTVDDPAIWVHPTDPAQSLVIGANHKESTVEVYDLAGRRLQRTEVRGTNNIDLRPGFPLGGNPVDLVGVAGGGTRTGRMTFFRVDPSRRSLSNVTVGDAVRVPAGYGFCMYHSRITGRFYAFGVNPGGRVDQMELFDDGGKVNARLVRTISVDPDPVENPDRNRDLQDHLEGCVADDGAGRLYVGEENRGIWEYGAEPGDPATKNDRKLVDSTDPDRGHIAPQVEGLTIVYGPGNSGFLIASSQGDHTYNVYRREPPHEFLRKVAVVEGSKADGCQRTDGIDATAIPLGPAFPRGLFVCQDNTNTEPAKGNQNFKYVPLEEVVPHP